jgi:hypothetical protein
MDLAPFWAGWWTMRQWALELGKQQSRLVDAVCAIGVTPAQHWRAPKSLVFRFCERGVSRDRLFLFCEIEPDGASR